MSIAAPGVNPHAVASLQSASAAAHEARRLPGLDALKGIAIIGVVAIHAAPSDAPGYREHVLNGVARLAVPLFLTISGFLLGSRQPSRAKAFLYFGKFLRLHVLYGALYWAVQPLFGTGYAPVTPKSAVMHFAAFSYAGQFFLFVLPQLYFVMALLVPERLWGSSIVVLGSLALGAGTVALVAWSFGAPGMDPLLRLLVGQAEASACLWLFPFSLGMWMGRRFAGSDRAIAGRATCLALALLSAGVAALDLPATAGSGYEDRFPYVRWSIGIGATLLAFTLPFAARVLRLGPVGALGRESFGIFVLNPLILGLLGHHFGYAATVSESVLYAVVTLAIAYLVTRVLRERIPFAFP